MYWQYVKERLDLEVLETPEGFALFKVLPEGVYIAEVYVTPEYRKAGIGRFFVNTIAENAKKLGHTKLITSCVPSGKTSDDALRAILAVGFKLINCEKDIIYLAKDI